MAATLNAGIYRMKSAYISGTRYRLYVTNSAPAYVYIIGSDITNKVTRVFPPTDNISPALLYSSSNIAIPDEKWYIEMDDTRGTDHVCVIYSAKPIDIKALMTQAERSAGTFSQRVRQALGSRAVAASAITYTPGQIGFKAESTATAVPVFIDIQHQ